MINTCLSNFKIINRSFLGFKQKQNLNHLSVFLAFDDGGIGDKRTNVKCLYVGLVKLDLDHKFLDHQLMI